jgi:outer membrane protein assembly factor BamB
MIGRRGSSPLLLAWLAAMVSCGGGQTRGHPLDSSWDDEEGKELAEFLSAWEEPSRPEPLSIAVGVVNDRTIVGRVLGQPSWRFEHPLESRPVIAGEMVVALGGGEIVALDAASGEVVWTRPAFGKLRGAGDDGHTTVVSIASLGASRSTVLAVARDGRVLRQIYEAATIGSPAVLADHAFLPYGNDTMVIFDLEEGREVARVISTTPIGRALTIDGALYFGENTLLRFDEQIVAARAGGGTQVTLPARPMPGDPAWQLPGTIASSTATTKLDRLRYYARPVEQGDRSPTIGRYALAYETLVVGLEAPSGATRWVDRGSDTVVAGAAGEEAVALCDTAGRVRWLDLADGRERRRMTLGERLIACAVQSGAAPARIRNRRRPPLAEQLRDAIAFEDARLLPLQLELLDDLGSLVGAAACRALLGLATRPVKEESGGRAALRRKAADRLAMRRTCAVPMIAALERAVEGPGPTCRLSSLLSPPREPVGALATALAGMEQNAAAPALARLLNLPGLDLDAVEAVAVALERLAGEDVRGWLLLFVARHGCSSYDARLVRGVLAAARTLARLGAGDQLRRLATDACDDEAMRTSLQAAAAAGP